MGALGEQASSLLLSQAAKSEGTPCSPAQLYFLTLEQVRSVPHPLLGSAIFIIQCRCRIESALLRLVHTLTPAHGRAGAVRRRMPFWTTSIQPTEIYSLVCRPRLEALTRTLWGRCG